SVIVPRGVADIHNLCGLVLGEYHLQERLDAGAYGTVYRCEQRLGDGGTRRHAVVKVLHRRLHDNNTALQRFSHEARLAAQFTHPYAAHVYAFGVDPERELFWIAMELVQGVALDRWLREHGPMPLAQLVPFFERVAQVTQAAHAHGIVH